MIDGDLSRMAGPESRGARVVNKAELEAFLDDACKSADAEAQLGGFFLIKLDAGVLGQLRPQDMIEAVYLVAQLARQPDILAQVDESTVAVVVGRLAQRHDAHIFVERVEDYVRTARSSWGVSTGVAVFPMCGPRGSDAWSKACRDLEGAISSDSWVHEIPRDTIRARETG